ncbi:unnamed protein product [Heligmosomoides polygyrus]|uniref:Olduvai domain-containing protein n=1 Tax=Heligmosomoides polygyrus TaxID=6339 RepID=A0A183FVL1_HELPZ|nr:unnamed protein product [Heligmosomoides polygyrus]
MKHSWWTGPAILKEPTSNTSKMFKYLETYERKGEDPGPPLPSDVSEILVASQTANRVEEENKIEDVFQVLEGRPLRETKLMDMDPRLMNNDLDNVYKCMKVKNQTASDFENDLEMALHAFHQQADVAAPLRSDSQHLRRDEAFFLEAPGKQVLQLNRCLRTGELTIEKMVKLATRHLLTERMSNDVFQFAYDNLGQLEDGINKLEGEHQRATRDFHRSKTTYYPEQEEEGCQLLQILRNDMSKDEQCSEKDIRQLRNKLKDQELELKLLQDTINSLKEQTTQNISNSALEVTVNFSKKTDQGCA